MNKFKITQSIDKIIIVLLAIQISSVSFSIALSSIAFGTWIGLWLIQILIDKKLQFNKSLFKEIKTINIFILLYILFEIFSRFFAVAPGEEFIGLKRLLLFLIFYVSLIKFLDKTILYRILFITLCVVSVVSIYELVLYSIKLKTFIDEVGFSEVRIDFLAYPLTSGQIKMMLILSVFPVLFAKDKFIVKNTYLIFILIPIFLSMILTQSRNVFLGTFVSFIIYGIVINRKFLLSFIVVLVLVWLFSPLDFQSRMLSIGNIDHPSNKSRLMMWDVGLKMFNDHPFTGVADSHMSDVYKLYKEPEFNGEGSHLHSNFIMILATTGIFGFLSYVGMMLLIFIKQIKIFKKEKESKIDRALLFGSILVMVSFNVAGVFEWSFGDHEVMTVFFFLISIPFIIYSINSPNKQH
ncbi:O-antigen ligase family protein [Bacteroidota bacterium]